MYERVFLGNSYLFEDGSLAMNALGETVGL